MEFILATEKEVKAFGARICFRRKRKYWIGLIIGSLIWTGLIITFMTHTGFVYVLSLLPLVVTIISFAQASNNTSKKIWEILKNKTPAERANWINERLK